MTWSMYIYRERLKEMRKLHIKILITNTLFKDDGYNVIPKLVWVPLMFQWRHLKTLFKTHAICSQLVNILLIILWSMINHGRINIDSTLITSKYSLRMEHVGRRWHRFDRVESDRLATNVNVCNRKFRCLC